VKQGTLAPINEPHHPGHGWAPVSLLYLNPFKGQKYVHRQYRTNRHVFILPTTFQHYGLPRSVPVFVRDRFESLESTSACKILPRYGFYLALVEPERFLPGRVAPAKGLRLAFRTDTSLRVSVTIVVRSATEMTLKPSITKQDEISLRLIGSSPPTKIARWISLIH
jgi:hypothetical protein